MADSIDIPFIDATSATGDELVAGLRHSSSVFLSGLPWLASSLDSLMRSSRDFFDLPETEKVAYQWDGVPPWQGWQPLYQGGTGTTSAAPMERFEVALPNPDAFDSRDIWAATFRQWPAEPATMMPSWAAYYLKMRELSIRLVTQIAESLELPAADLPAWTTDQHANLCVNHYLAQDAAPTSGQERNRAHTDIGGITLLWGENTTGGLHVQKPDTGEWVPVEFPPDTVLLQAGDLLHLWTNGLIPKNNHRVVNPSEWPAPERYSVVYFHHPDLETWVAPVTKDAADGVTARDHVLARQTSAYST
ncbi:MAG TPA: 2OG-Fe(II) oxygenase family protein [Jatrophihabitans sp.]|jgi:isopenicillin N synthase-like dioxygenase